MEDLTGSTATAPGAASAASAAEPASAAAPTPDGVTAAEPAADQDFSGVADTLFIALASRVVVSQRFPKYFYDEKALKLANLPKVKAINQKNSEYFAMASAARTRGLDNYAAKFLDANPSGCVTNLGAGLETINWRVGASRPNATWCSVDFPDVLENRRKILGQAPNEKLIPGDIKALDWVDQMDTSKPTLFVLAGVLQYFKPNEVLALFDGIRERFPHAEVAFDAGSESAMKFANRYVKKTGNQDAMMWFHVNDAGDFAKEAGATLLDSRGFYDEARAMIGKKCTLYTRIAMRVADSRGMCLLVYLRL